MAQPPSKKQLLLISAVLPVDRRSGQQMRVYNKLCALQAAFDVTFLSVAAAEQVESVRRAVEEMGARAVILPQQGQTAPARLWCRWRALRSGLLPSNHLWRDIELTPQRISSAITPAAYDLVVYEYWHTHRSTALFRAAGVPCVLDMHDILWRIVALKMKMRNRLPSFWQRRRVAAYRRQEERAWLEDYDAIIAINLAEQAYVRQRVGPKPLFFAPMGIDLSKFPYCWSPAQPPRVGFFGNLQTLGNVRSALRCANEIMPLLWQQQPLCELWIVGANPPPELKELAADPRIRVTGFIDEPAEILATMRLILCPWQGQLGFRSRIIECMALGVPVIANDDAVYGMDLRPEHGLLLAESNEALAQQAGRLFDPDFAATQSQAARQQVESHFSFGATYGRLTKELYAFTA